MNERDLNEKLVKWVWPKARIRHGDFGSDFIPSGKPFRTHFIDAVPVPPFTQSLDACFKWLVPQLRFTSIHQGTEQNANHCGAELYYTENLLFYAAESTTPALALCLAIEQIIDGQSGG